MISRDWRRKDSRKHTPRVWHDHSVHNNKTAPQLPLHCRQTSCSHLLRLRSHVCLPVRPDWFLEKFQLYQPMIQFLVTFIDGGFSLFCFVLLWKGNGPLMSQLDIVKVRNDGPGLVAQLVRAPFWYVKVVGSIPGQGTYKNQPMNAWMSRTTNWCLSLSLKSMNKKNFF